MAKKPYFMEDHFSAGRPIPSKITGKFSAHEVPSWSVLEFADAVPRGMMLSDQAARSMS
jgi:hypothetical protein